MVNPSFVKTVAQAIVRVESSSPFWAPIRLNLGCNIYVVFTSRFTTVSAINRECHIANRSLMQQDWSLSTDDLFQLMDACSPGSLFSLSYYEQSVGKCWWTAEVVDTIMVQKGYRITVSYDFTFFSSHQIQLRRVFVSGQRPGSRVGRDDGFSGRSECGSGRFIAQRRADVIHSLSF